MLCQWHFFKYRLQLLIDTVSGQKTHNYRYTCHWWAIVSESKTKQDKPKRVLMFPSSFDISYSNGALPGSKIDGAICVGERKLYLSPALPLLCALAITVQRR